MASLREAIARGARLDVMRPYPRIEVDASIWLRVTREISKGEGDLVALWSDGAEAHMMAWPRGDATPCVLSIACPDARFPSVGHLHPPAQRLERAIHDIYGLTPNGAADDRPWLDHGVWGVVHPGGSARPAPTDPAPYRFLAAEGEPLHQIAVGPVHAGIIEPGHFRFSANGETVVRLEQRFGYAHKGVETLMRGADIDRALRLAGRVSGDSTVAYAWAASGALEAALDVVPPPRATALRAVMAEIERIANHLGDIGAVCNDAAFSLMLAHCGVLRERVLRAAKAAFGHRLMMDCLAPGGLARDMAPGGARAIENALLAIDASLPGLLRVYDSTASLQDRTVGTGKTDAALVAQFACGGFVGRAAGRRFDARHALRYPPYGDLDFDVPVRKEGDVDARVRLRFDEIGQSMAIVRRLLLKLPAGPIRAEWPTDAGACEGVAMIEGFRGDIVASLRLDAAGRIAHCHLRDPSWFQWPLLEAAIEGNIVADFPLCNKSFNCAYSGHDL